MAVALGVGATSKHFKYGLCAFHQHERSKRGTGGSERCCEERKVSVMPGAKSQRHCKFVLASNNPLGIGLGIEVGIASQSQSQSEELTAVSGASYIMRSPSLTVSPSLSLSSFFSCLLFKGATLKVAGCQVSHAFASFSLSTATFFLFIAPHSAPARLLRLLIRSCRSPCVSWQRLPLGCCLLRN